MPTSQNQIRDIKKRTIKARKLYKTGLSTRQVAPLVERTHAWVALVVKDLSTIKQ